MNNRSEFSKLQELRAKTDRQLFALIAAKLQAGLGFARAIADPDRRFAWFSRDDLQSRAEKAYTEARTLLPWLTGIPIEEQLRLQNQLDQLGELLENLSIAHGLRAHAAC